MPLPWKKTRCTRISQLVADHLNSPKRGGSLVVETGFPTSLVDLFVKNRDRLKKPSRRKRSSYSDPIFSQFSPTQSDDSVTLITPSSFGALASVAMNQSTCKIVESDVDSGVRRTAEEGGDVAKANSVFWAVLKIFFVVVLALSTKKFAVGITLSAFLLFLIEIVGRRFCKIHVASERLRFTIKRVLLFLFVSIKLKFLISEEESTAIVLADSSGLDVQEHASEIEVLPALEEIDMPTLEKAILEEEDEEEEEDRYCEIFEPKMKKSRKERIKSKIKKLVPKKLRRSKKKRPDKDLDEQEDLDGDDNSVSLSSSATFDGELEVDLASSTASMVAASAIIEEEEEEEEEQTEQKGNSGEEQTEQKRNSGYLFLIVIVLCGLIGGRFLALSLTLLWCFLLKSGKTIGRYVKKVAF